MIFHCIPRYFIVYLCYTMVCTIVYHCIAMVYHGIPLPWCTMECHGMPWNSMEYHGIPWKTIEYRRMPWYTMVYHERPLCIMLYRCTPWYAMLFQLCHGIPSKFHRPKADFWGVWGAEPPSIRGVWGAEPPRKTGIKFCTRV